MRFAIDTGGTFTDLLVEDDEGALQMFKASTRAADPVEGVLDALAQAAAHRRLALDDFLRRASTLIYGTTHPINAIITGTTARTAFLTTRGHPDILTLREGGRGEPFNFTTGFPRPLVSRSLTFEIGGRIAADGSEVAPLDEADALAAVNVMIARGVEAVGVCLLWSVVNPSHELRIGELLAMHMPGAAVTLSHLLNPTLREYRRASSACIDASLKPMMNEYLTGLEQRLSREGFAGQVLVVTSQGGVMHAADVAKSPIHLINSGPSMAPIAGGYFASLDETADTAIIADTGGTTYDVSVVLRGETPITRETWIGTPYQGHMTGFPSVDVKSVGAGGGSIAWIDEGGMLHVGPQSAASLPGPVCYGRGGRLPTVTDAAVALGYIDPDFFLGGAMRLDKIAARRALEAEIARPLGLTVEDAALAIVMVTTENMVQAIVDITLSRGIDTRKATLVGGGGAAGLNSVLVARRLDTPRLIIPDVAAALSAAGAMMSDLRVQLYAHSFTTSEAFDFGAVNATLRQLEKRAQAFIDGPAKGALNHVVSYKAEARYPEQVWEIEIPVPTGRFNDNSDVERLLEEFHQMHEKLFAVRDEKAGIEIVSWSVAVASRIHPGSPPRLAPAETVSREAWRPAHFPGLGAVKTRVCRLQALRHDEDVVGPAIVETPFTTIVVNPGAIAVRKPSGTLSILPGLN
jgi:N-methylhydantoinase A